MKLPKQTLGISRVKFGVRPAATGPAILLSDCTASNESGGSCSCTDSNCNLGQTCSCQDASGANTPSCSCS